MSDLSEHHLGTDLSSYADDILMRTLLMQSHLETTASAITVLRSRVQLKVSPTSEDETEDELARFVQQADATVSQSRSAKVVVGKAIRSLQELKARSLSLNQSGDREFNVA